MSEKEPRLSGKGGDNRRKDSAKSPLQASAKVAAKSPLQASAKVGAASASKGDKSSKKKPLSAKKKDDVVVTIDLTNPEDLMRKLEMIDFTDEETEQLINQAYEVNKLLKKELQKHEFESLRQSFARSVTISASTGEKTSGLMNGTLPPVEKGGKSNLASLSFSRHGSNSMPASATNSRSSLGSRQSSSLKPKKSAAPKAEWNDRWGAD